MKRLIAAALFAASATTAHADLSQVVLTTELVHKDGSTTPLLYEGLYDVYVVLAKNPNEAPVTSLELEFVGDFLNLAGLTFKPGPDFPIPFGFEAPDTFFALPLDVDLAKVLAVDVEDTDTRLAASYTIAGGAELIPAGGVLEPIATLSVPADTVLDVSRFGGRAVIGGEFVPVGVIPEPAGATLVFLSIAGWATKRRRYVGETEGQGQSGQRKTARESRE